jgi:hypothetical protein
MCALVLEITAEPFIGFVPRWPTQVHDVNAAQQWQNRQGKDRGCGSFAANPCVLDQQDGELREMMGAYIFNLPLFPTPSLSPSRQKAIILILTE